MKTGERSKPPSVRPGIRLSVRAVHDRRAVRGDRGAFGLPRRGLAPVRVRRSIDPRPSTCDRSRRCRSTAVPSNRVRDPWIRTTSCRSPAGGSRAVWHSNRSLCGSTPLPCGRVRAHHRSGRDVSFLFQSQRSPAPDLRPVTCPNRWGDFPRGRDTSRGDGSRWSVARPGGRATFGGRAVTGATIAAAGLALPLDVGPSAE